MRADDYYKEEQERLRQRFVTGIAMGIGFALISVFAMLILCIAMFRFV